MEKDLLIEADRIVAGLTPGKQEAVREIMVAAKRRGFLDAGARGFLDRATQGTLVADVLAQALAETADAPDASAAPIEAPLDAPVAAPLNAPAEAPIEPPITAPGGAPEGGRPELG